MEVQPTGKWTSSHGLWSFVEQKLGFSIDPRTELIQIRRTMSIRRKGRAVFDSPRRLGEDPQNEEYTSWPEEPAMINMRKLEETTRIAIHLLFAINGAAGRVEIVVALQNRHLWPLLIYSDSRP